METLKIIGASHKVILVKDNIVKIMDLGGLFSSSKREKIYDIKNVIGVEVKQPGGLYKGYIQIQVAGQLAPNTKGSTSSSMVTAAQDENSILFSGEENYQIALKMQKHILEYKR